MFTTTISYHGPSLGVNTETGTPVDFTEKGTEKDLADSAMRAPSTGPGTERDISELPV